MSRYLPLGILVLVVAAGSLFFYRTQSTEPTAEFGGASLRIEYATTTEAQAKGLSGRTHIPGDYGMLFVFPTEGKHGFWMKDMIVPIDIFWVNAKGQVVHIAQNVATSTYPDVLYPTVPAKYVLETAAGFAERHNIGTGTPLLLKN